MIKYKSTIMTISLFVLISVILGSVGCAGTEQKATDDKPTLVLGDAGWDSMRFHNDVARIIIEKGYGYKTDIKMGSTPITFTGLRQGDIDIYMEAWSDNISEYPEALEKGDILELSLNFGDNRQGLYVPRYVIEGDSEKGIEALAPDLKSIYDLPKYWKLFKDPEDETKGRIYGAIPGWLVSEQLAEKVKNYGLNENYNLFRPGSDTALSSSIVKAIEEGKPWLGYYWEPTWVIGKYDMVLLEEPSFDINKWKEGDYKCAFPSCQVTVCVNKDMLEKAPDVVEFLKKYETSSELTSEALAYMQDNNASTEDTAKWFLKNNKDMWNEWVPEDVVKSVEAFLK